ncbi:uncharacterized protein A4U43_C03F25390 [Asparagus officinalis]|uniref:Uncharacterized protein n=1 Tax=Asparagus officinalis TaxID=4686 RepID=A0A5P1FDQ0_ASPOF|nr:uncharacterized protein A4U43_C03F25390 [Asparagus officinalis]
MPTFAPDLSVSTKRQWEMEVGPSKEEVTNKASYDEVAMITEVGEGQAATVLEPSLGVVTSVVSTPLATEAILPAFVVATELIPSTLEEVAFMLVADQQVLAQSTQPIISKGTAGASITVSSAEEKEEEEDVDYSGGSDAIVDDVGSPIEALVQNEEVSIREAAPIQEEEVSVASMVIVTSTSISTTIGPVSEVKISSSTKTSLIMVEPSVSAVSTTTLVTVATSAQVQASTPIADEALLSLTARMRKRAVDRMIKNFWSFPHNIIKMALDEGCSFEECKPVLQIYLDSLTRLVGADAASLYETRLWLVEKDV